MKILIFVMLCLPPVLHTSGLHGYNNQFHDILNKRRLGKCMRKSSHSYIKIAKLIADSANMEHISKTRAGGRMEMSSSFGEKPRIGGKILTSSSIKANISLLKSGFDTNTSEILTVSEQCLVHTEAMLHGMLQKHNWAIQMNDASGKLPGNILRGNFMWLGDYDECVSVKVNTQLRNDTYSLKGGYCYITVPVHSPELCSVDVSFSVGVCLPDICKETDVLNILNSVLVITSNGTLTGDKITCQEPNIPLNTRAVIVIIVISLIIVIMIAGTAYDLYLVQKRKWMEENERIPLLEPKTTDNNTGVFGEVILCFSVYTNAAQILSMKKVGGNITSINGIRVISMSLIILAHTIMYIIKTSDNILDWTDFMRTVPASALVLSVTVDSFFTISGLLLAYLTLKNLEQNDGTTNWAKFYFHRIWRLTPPYALVLMVYISLFPYTGSGPMWLKEGYETQCEETWFFNLLYINNFLPMDKMCFGISWYLANDMQFYVISPVFILLLYRRHVAGVCLILGCLLGSWITTGVYTAYYKPPLTSFIINMGNVEHFDFVYNLPFCRIGPYLVGLYTGYLLYRTKCKYEIEKWVNACGWIITTVVGLFITFEYYLEFNGDGLSPVLLAIYTATYRSLWAACVAWIIFSCTTGYGGFVDSVLSCKVFLPFSRLTYMTYLVHPIIIYHYQLTRRRMIPFSSSEVIYEFSARLILAYIAAFLFSLAFELPMMGLEKIMFKKKPKKETVKKGPDSESNCDAIKLRTLSN